MNWFEIWFNDMQALIETMIRNMNADLDAGYDPNGSCIIRQKVEIGYKQKAFERQMDAFKEMDDKKVNRWCYYDLKKRGAIL